jgi:hypothetical protein
MNLGIWLWVKTLVPGWYTNIGGKWIVIPPNIVMIGFDPSPSQNDAHKNEPSPKFTNRSYKPSPIGAQATLPKKRS